MTGQRAAVSAVRVNERQPLLAWTLQRLRFDPRTIALVRHDIARFRARTRRAAMPATDRPLRLHLGCGDRRVEGWLNCDVSGSEYDLDLGAGRLPFPDSSARVVVMQHVVEHLSLYDQLLPLLSELHRVCAPDGRVWLSCPDLAKVCAGYVTDRGRALEQDRRQRWPDYSRGDAPVQQFINDVFQGKGMHRNLFDFELLEWALRRGGFSFVERVSEAELLAAHPEFPPRRDDAQSLYVVSGKSEQA